MAFDPIQEDCHRLILATMRRKRIMPLENQPFIERCMEEFQEDPSQLIKSDRDRSFHLVARATELIDYRVPFIPDDTQAEEEANEAEHELAEAISLDKDNWDAQRMLTALQADSNTSYMEYLLAHKDEVKRSLDEALVHTSDPYDREFAGDLARRPYLRWLAALASQSLIAGRYRLALDAVEESLALAPDDPADIRFTGLFIMAKLECSREDLRRYRARHRLSFQAGGILRRRNHQGEKIPDAWSLIAELSVAYHEFDFVGATRVLRNILRLYPRAARALYYQAEFPEGVYARVNVTPQTDDELILALSEATPLLQEGMGSPTNACFATWVGSHELVREAFGEQDRHASTAQQPHLGGEN